MTTQGVDRLDRRAKERENQNARVSSTRIGPLSNFTRNFATFDFRLGRQSLKVNQTRVPVRGLVGRERQKIEFVFIKRQRKRKRESKRRNKKKKAAISASKMSAGTRSTRYSFFFSPPPLPFFHPPRVLRPCPVAAVEKQHHGDPGVRRCLR